MNAPHGQRVIFVDDEEGVRASWHRFLGEHGFDVTTAEDGQKAIAHLMGEEPVDVVVADLRMPGLDGLQLLEWVHEKRPRTPFILLTGYGSEEVERKARELGAYDYLDKPISPDTLAAVITAAAQLERPAVAPAESAVREDRGEMGDGTVRLAGPSVEEAPGDEAVTAGVAEATESAVRGGLRRGVETAEAAPGQGLRSGVETAAALVAAPILGLAFVVFLPLIGFVALFWFLGERLLEGREAQDS